MKGSTVRCVAAGVLVVAISLVAAPAASAPTDAQERAARAFESGERAFATSDFRRAATYFEEANRLRPHPSSLFNAADAWRQAGELARAANLYARLLASVQTDRERHDADVALAAIAPRVGRLDVAVDTAVSGAAVDGVSLPLGGTLYVESGDHVVSARHGGLPIRKPVRVPAGAIVLVKLEPGLAGPGRTTAPEADRPTNGIAPVVAVAAGGVAFVATGAAVWSGLDVLEQEERYSRTGANADLDRGLDKQLRTNVLIGVALATAALAVVAAVFTDWHAPLLGRRTSFGRGSISF